jgi:hypothetical protein
LTNFGRISTQKHSIHIWITYVYFKP